MAHQGCRALSLYCAIPAMGRPTPSTEACLRNGRNKAIAPYGLNRLSDSVRLARRFQHLLEPVPHGGAADALIVDLAVVVAAFLVREEAHRLLPGADRVKALLRLSQRDLRVSFTMQHQERAGDPLHHTVELERREPLEGFLLRGRVHHP